MTTIRKSILAVAVACIAVGAIGQFGPALTWDVPSIEWLWPGQSPVVSAVIVEESKDRTKLPAAQIGAIMAAPGLKVSVVDKNVVGPDKKPPASLVPFLDAAKGSTLPVLVAKHKSGKISVQPLPANKAALQEAIK